MSNSYFPIYLDFRRGVDPRLLWTRASGATYRGADGVWREIGPHSPRQHFAESGAAIGVLTEGQRINQNPNPRFEPSAAGLPTGYNTSAIDGGLTYTYSAQTLFNGVQGKELAISGTTAGTSTNTFNCVVVPAAAQISGQVWAASRFLRLVGGGYTGLTNSTPAYRSAGGASIVVAPQVPSDGALYRQVLILTSADTPANLLAHQRLGFTSGASINVTMFNGWEQAERGPYPTTPILPPVGAPAVTTRAADLGVLRFADWMLAAQARGLLLVHFTAAPGLDAADADQEIADVSDGTADNRIVIRRRTTGTIRARSIVGGVDQGEVTSVATVANSAAAVLALRFGNGQMAISLNGAAIVSTSTTLPASLTQVGILPHNGTCVRIGYRPTPPNATAPTDAEVIALSRQGPLA